MPFWWKPYEPLLEAKAVDGAEAIKELLGRVELERLARELRLEILQTQSQRRARASAREAGGGIVRWLLGGWRPALVLAALLGAWELYADIGTSSRRLVNSVLRGSMRVRPTMLAR